MFDGEKNPGWSLVPKRPSSALVNSAKVPGPGSYTPEYFGKAPAWRVGSATRPNLGGSTAPGPGAYNPRVLGLNGPSYRVGTGLRQNLSQTTNFPGPGTYQLRPSTGDGPKYGMTPKREDLNGKLMATIPGPGTYTPRVGFVKERPPSHL